MQSAGKMGHDATRFRSRRRTNRTAEPVEMKAICAETLLENDMCVHPVIVFGLKTYTFRSEVPVSYKHYILSYVYYIRIHRFSKRFVSRKYGYFKMPHEFPFLIRQKKRRCHIYADPCSRCSWSVGILLGNRGKGSVLVNRRVCVSAAVCFCT